MKTVFTTLLIIIYLNVNAQEKITLNDTCTSSLIISNKIGSLKLTTGTGNYSFFKPLYEVKQSKTKFFTQYKITVYERNYYTNVFQVINGHIYFNEYKRDGSLKNGYEFPISKVEIYQSK